jgi:hypothetical protein
MFHAIYLLLVIFAADDHCMTDDCLENEYTITLALYDQTDCWNVVQHIKENDPREISIWECREFLNNRGIFWGEARDYKKGDNAELEDSKTVFTRMDTE